MAGSRRKILGHVMSGLCTKMNRTKQLGSDVMETPLKRCLNTWDMTLLGIGHMVGAGVYVLTGPVAKDMAGPGIVLSFLLAGMTSLLAALCYAEFGARVPKAGSAYVYTYVCVGEFWAFVIGWNIVLEHMIGAASVARAWSGYVDSMIGGVIGNATEAALGTMHEDLLSKRPDVLAAAVCLVYAALLAIGVKASSVVNSALTLVNMVVMLLVIVLGFAWAPGFSNWQIPGQGFLPFGFSGVVAGAATCFYAFVGFDSIATAGEEAKDPARSIPIATITSMVIVMFGYILVGAALTLLEPFSSIIPEAALPEALAAAGLPWARYAVSIGALCGMTTTLFGALFSLPRCLYAMAADGLLFSCFARINPRTQLPLLNLAVSGVCSAIIALLFDLEKLVEFMSIGTLMAYTIVSACVIILRYRPTSNADSGISEDEVDDTQPGIQGELTGRLKPNFWWLRGLVGQCEPGSAVAAAVLMFASFSVALCVQLQYSTPAMQDGAWWPFVIIAALIICLLGCLLVIAGHRQNTTGLRFTVPLVPLIPALSIFCNIELMVHLNALTWLRFLTWMSLGLLLYFLYGIHHSKESEPVSSYAVLMSSSEAVKEPWGAISPSHMIPPISESQKIISTDEKAAIVEEEEIQG